MRRRRRYVAGDASDVGSVLAAWVYAAFLPVDTVRVPRRLNRKMAALTLVLPPMVKRWADFFSESRGDHARCAYESGAAQTDQRSPRSRLFADGESGDQYGCG